MLQLWWPQLPSTRTMLKKEDTKISMCKHVFPPYVTAFFLCMPPPLGGSHSSSFCWDNLHSATSLAATPSCPGTKNRATLFKRTHGDPINAGPNCANSIPSITLIKTCLVWGAEWQHSCHSKQSHNRAMGKKKVSICNFWWWLSWKGSMERIKRGVQSEWGTLKKSSMSGHSLKSEDL